MFFQAAPAETTGYMIFGFVVIFGTMAVYLASLVIRTRNFRRDLELLDEMEVDE